MVAPKKQALLFDRVKWSAAPDTESLKGVKRVGLAVYAAGPVGDLVQDVYFHLRLAARLRERGVEVVGPSDELRVAAKDYAVIYLRVKSSWTGTGDNSLVAVVRTSVDREALVRTDGRPVRRYASVLDTEQFQVAQVHLAVEACGSLIDAVASTVCDAIAAANRPPGLLNEEPPPQTPSDNPTAPEEKS